MNPDYSLFVGDTLDKVTILENERKRQVLIDFIKEISRISTTVFCLGSHDFVRKTKSGTWEEFKNDRFFMDIRELENTFLLDNESYINQNAYIAGITQPFEYFNPPNSLREDKDILIEVLKQHRQLLTKLKPDKINFLLTHSPMYLLKQFDYFLAGHTHNGLMPPILYELWNSTAGIIIPDKQIFQKDLRETLRKKTDKLLVNGPLTMFSESKKYLYPFNIFYPSYLSVLQFYNNVEWNQEFITRNKSYNIMKN